MVLWEWDVLVVNDSFTLKSGGCKNSQFFSVVSVCILIASYRNNVVGVRIKITDIIQNTRLFYEELSRYVTEIGNSCCNKRSLVFIRKFLHHLFWIANFTYILGYTRCKSESTTLKKKRDFEFPPRSPDSSLLESFKISQASVDTKIESSCYELWLTLKSSLFDVFYVKH